MKTCRNFVYQYGLLHFAQCNPLHRKFEFFDLCFRSFLIPRMLDKLRKMEDRLHRTITQIKHSILRFKVKHNSDIEGTVYIGSSSEKQIQKRCYFRIVQYSVRKFLYLLLKEKRNSVKQEEDKTRHKCQIKFILI